MDNQLNEDESLASLLTEYMNRANFGTTTLAKSVNKKFGEKLITRSTLTGWRDGHIKTLRESSWESLVCILHVLELSRNEADRVLQVAGLRSLEELWKLQSNETRAQLLFQPWIDDIENKSASTRPIGETVVLSTLKPLTTEQREQIHESKAVLMSGINMYRTFYVFQYEFRHMLSLGGQVRVLLSHPDGAAMQMSALRSESRTPIEIQKKRTYETLELLALWRSEMPGADVQVRLIDYLPPFGITIMHPSDNSADAGCLVRLFTFRSSTSMAPAFTLNSNRTPEWFAFFSEQFEKMWEAGEDYDLKS
jgi:hypothetical protein